MSSCPQADADAGRQELAHPGVERSGVGIGDHGHGGLAQERGQLLKIGLRVQRHGTRVMGEDPSLPAGLDGADRHHLQGAQTRVAGVIHQHGNRPVVGHGDVEHLAHVLPGVRVRVLDPRNAPYHVHAQGHRLPYQAGRSGLAHNAVLGEGNHLQLHHAAELLLDLKQRLDALETRLGIHVGESPDVGVAVHRGRAKRLSGILDDPVLAVGLLDPRRRLDGLHGAAHPLAMIGAQG